MTEKEAYQKGYSDALRDIMQNVQEFYKEEARPNGNMSDEEKANAMMRGLYVCDPEKNYECHKGSSCQETCFLTSDPRFKKDEPSFTEQYERLNLVERMNLSKNVENYIVNVKEDEDGKSI